MVRKNIELALIPYVIQLGPTKESQMVAKKEGDSPSIILKVD
jgi:hypothetical protein